MSGAVAAAVEALECRRLLCFNGLGMEQSDILVNPVTDGFEVVPTLAQQAAEAAAPGMPNLNSRPGAPVAIFMDFDGDATTGTQPYSEDGDGTTFNATEAANITEAWEEMSTYFSIFDVNVTTMPPTVPTAWLAVGNNISGGYSYVNVFPNTYPRSFNQSSDARNRVSGLAHEIGHNFGLHHQADFDLLGNLVNEYSSGYDALHGPLMGVDYARNVHKWFIGHPSNSASSLQDDLTLIANDIKPYQPAGGDGYRVDDFANTIASASTLTLSGGSATQSGIIERLNDVDMFSFSLASPTALRVLATPHGVSGVDLKLALYDSSGAMLAEKDATTNWQEMSFSLSGGTYHVGLSSHGNYGDVGQYTLSLSTPTLPAGWKTQDIAANLKPGNAAYNGATSTFTLTGTGSTLDQGRFAFQTLSGDGSIVARVASVTGNSNAPGGVMIREGTGATARMAYAAASPSSGYSFVYRASTGGQTSLPGNWSTLAAPSWVKLQRTGNVVTGYKSADGVNWTALGSLTVSWSSALQIGLFAGAMNATGTTNAVFTNVTFTGNVGNPAPVYNALPTPGNLQVAPGPGTALSITWDDIDGENGYAIERSEDGVNFVTAAVLAPGTTAFNNTGLAGSLRYFYRVSAVAGDGSWSAPSPIVSSFNRPSAVTNFSITSLNTTGLVLNWRDTDNETGYRIERSADGGSNWTTLTAVGMNVPSFYSTGLTQGITYTYRVTPTSDVGDGVSAVGTRQTRLSAVTGLAFASVEARSIRLTWNANTPHAAGYRIQRSTNGTSFSTLASVAAGVGTYTDTTVSPLGEYHYRVIATNAQTEGIAGATVRGGTPAVSLPVGWMALDIGANPPGGSGFSGSTAVLLSGGSISGTNDAFQFLFQKTTGNGEIIARIATRESEPTGNDIGLMFRESLAANARHVFVRFSNTSVAMEHRGGATSSVSAATTVPVWLKLTRSGDVFTGAWSSNGSTWTTLGWISVTGMSQAAYVGIAGASASSSAIAKSTLTNISGSALNQPDTVAPGAPAITAFSSDTGSSAIDRVTSDNTLMFTGAAEAGTLVIVTRNGSTIGSTRANALGQWTLDHSGTVLDDGVHAFTATAVDAWNNASAASSAFNVAVDTDAPVPAGWTFNTSAQRVQLQFAEDINAASLSGADLTLLNVSTGVTSSVSFTYDAPTRTASFGTGSPLPDGHYRATLAAAAVSDVAGNTSAGPHVFEFFNSIGSSAADSYTIRLSVDGAAVEVVKNGVTFVMPKAALDTLSIDPGAGIDELHLDFSRGHVVLPAGMTLVGFETLRLTGSGAADGFAIAGNVITATGQTFDVTGAQMIRLASGSFELGASGTERGLELGAGAAARAVATQKLASLSIAAGGSLDLLENDLVLNYSSVSPVGIWTGSAYDGLSGDIAAGRIFSSTATATLTTLGVAESREALGLTGSQTGTFSGQPVDSTAALIKFTWAGDANLDGVINIDDYGRIDANVAQSGSVWGWFNGDFNYDGKINIDDYGIIDSNIGEQDDVL